MNSSKSNRVIDHFCVISIDQELGLNDPFSSNDLRLTGLEVKKGELKHADIDNNFPHIKEKKKLLDISGNGKTWLLAIFDQQGKPPITQIEVLYMPTENSRLKILKSLELNPVPVMRIDELVTDHRFEGSIDTFDLYRGDYDLTTALGNEIRKGFQLVRYSIKKTICFRIQGTTNFQSPICDLISQKATKTNKNKFRPSNTKMADYTVRIPPDYKALSFPFGQIEKNIVLCFKKSKSVFELYFAPKCIDAYPDGEIIHAVGMFCFPDGIRLRKDIKPPQTFSFIITQEDGSRVYGTCLSFYEPLSPALKRQLSIPIEIKSEVYVSKAICILSHFPFTYNFKQLLKQVYRLSLSRSEVPIERIVSNFVNDIRAPAISETNFTEIHFHIANETIIFRNTVNFPYLSKDCLDNLFLTLRSEQIIDLVEAMMLERKILLISKHKALLTQISEALVALLYPFVWNHVLIPILPRNLRAYIDAPVPFLIGLPYDESIEEIPKPSDIIQVYLDKGEMIYTESLPPLQEKAYLKLKKKLKPFDDFLNKNKEAANEYLDNIEMAYVSLPFEALEFEKINHFAIRDSFLEFMSGFMQNYTKFIVSLL